ncbi:MAG: translation initiation factor IF-2 [Armatimonadota bacterium]|nr:translation initiation factor IF-2 [Armatimonadota bacterium]
MSAKRILIKDANEHMASVEIAALAKELNALPSQVTHVLGEFGAFPKDGLVELDADSLELVKEAVAELAATKTITVVPGATPRDLAHALDVPQPDVQKSLMKLGVLASLATALQPDVAEKVVGTFGYKVNFAEPAKPVEKEVAPKRRVSSTGEQTRPPVVTILGHVDHGKTSLLDYIRKTKVVDKEHGGITQHIGAYQVITADQKITFLDTPGHEAFTAMRARGAQVTDIAILVVAADDGVMPQTIEALNHARNAEVPIIVALNKIDKEGANPARVKQQLVQHGLIGHEFGGDTEIAEVSAKTGLGVDDLLELILLQSGVMDLKAEPSGDVEGVVIEAKIDKGRGPVATILVKNGTLKQGDTVLVGNSYGRLKAIFDFAGKPIKDAGPSVPVEILGLNKVPNAGDMVAVYLDEREARDAAEGLTTERRERELTGTPSGQVTLADLQRRLSEENNKELRIIIKGDVQGSVEAVRGLLDKIDVEEVEVRVLHYGVGTIGESDIMLAKASDAIVVGFNTRVEPKARDEAARQHVEVRQYNIIYELIEDIEKAVIGMLEPKFEEQYMGTVEIRAVFKLTKQGFVAGCYVTDGKVVRNAQCRVKRAGEIAYEGKIDSLKHIKEDVREMAAGFECGIQFVNWNDFKEGDIIEAYEVVRVG